MWEAKLLGIVLAMEVIFVGSNTLNKAAMTQGMSNYVYITYTHAMSLVILIPAAFFFHRRNNRPPPIKCSIILKMFLLSIINFGCSICFYSGVQYSSPTLASAISNLSLAFSFIMAIIFRMETLNLRSKSCILKLIGTTVSISGAFIMIFYHGLPIIVGPSPTTPSLSSLVQLQSQPNWVVGGTFLLISCILISLAYVIKTWIARDFPSVVLITLITFFFETIVVSIVTLIVENDASVWTLTIDIKLIAILFGTVAVCLLNMVETWVCRLKGPVFVAMFKPLQMIIAVIMGVSFLGDILHLGSVIGGLIIAAGFYTVIKGTSEEEEMLKKEDEDKLIYSCIKEEESYSLKIPMLHDKSLNA